MDTALALEVFKQIETYLVAAGIALSRMVGLVMVMPAFTRSGLTGILRTGVALALSLPLIPMIVATVIPQQLSFAQMAAILLKEVMVGVAIAIVLGIPIWAAEAAGEILDLQRGATFGDISDPLSTSTNNVTGTLFALIVVAMYFASGGVGLTMRAAYDSYNLWPLVSFMPVFSDGSGKLLLGLLDDILGMGLMLVIPIVISFLLADLSLALVARAAPQMNIFILSLTVKNLAFAILLVLYSAFLLPYMKEDLTWLIDASRRLENFSPPQN